nr:reverse transcriptase zinc-binding domain-containing protein [Tanacetum cinerariifolium]
MSLDRLPHRLNLLARGIDIPTISCPSFNGNVESADHIFFECDLVKEEDELTVVVVKVVHECRHWMVMKEIEDELLEEMKNFALKSLRLPRQVFGVAAEEYHRIRSQYSLEELHSNDRNLDDKIELPKSQPKRTYNEDIECEIVMVKMPKCMAWLDDEPIGDLDIIEDKGKNPSPQSTPQVLPSFEVYTPPMTHLEEVEETIGILIEVEPLDHMKLEDLGLNTDTHDLFLSSKGFPSVDESKP